MQQSRRNVTVVKLCHIYFFVALLVLLEVQEGGVDHDVGPLPYGGQKGALPSDSFLHGEAAPQGVTASGLLKSTDQGFVGRIQKDDPNPRHHASDVVDDLQKIIRPLDVPDIYRRRDPRLAGGVVSRQQIEELRQQTGGDIVYSKKAKVLEDLEGRRLAGTGHARHDHEILKSD